jgi:transposase
MEIGMVVSSASDSVGLRACESFGQEIPSRGRRSHDSAHGRHPLRAPPNEPDAHEEAAGVPRLQLPNRGQLELRSVDLDGLLGPVHRARLVWAFVLGLDLGPLYARIKAIEGHSGRPPIDPAILVALWLYTTLEGVGSTRALDRLCAEHDAYRWLAGGVGLNYHTLAAFRVEHADVLDRLLTQSAAALLADGLVTLTAVAQDGVRVRAAAGAASYRRRPTLDRFLGQAEAHVRALKAELDDDPAASSRRVAAARERAGRERTERVRHALAHLPAIEAAKARNAKRDKPAPEARTSTTDPEARVMKMADGGWRPAYNAQLVTDTASQVIVGLDVSNKGNDQGQLGPIVRQLRARYGRAPDAWLADAGFLANAEIEEFGAPVCGTTLYLPVGAGTGPRNAEDLNCGPRGTCTGTATSDHSGVWTRPYDLSVTLTLVRRLGSHYDCPRRCDCYQFCRPPDISGPADVT